MPRFNGHKNWNHWNVALWVNNDAGLYALAKRLKRISRSKARAANLMMDHLAAQNVTKTPDGAPYSVTTLMAAMKEI